MTLTELEAAVPALKEYTKNMPEDIRSRCTVRTHAAGSIIHQKNIIRILCQFLHFFVDLRNYMGQRMLRTIAGDHKTYFFYSVHFLLLAPS